MPLIRGHHSFDDHFTQIPNEWVRDKRLSLKAIGLLTQLMSHSPGWNMSLSSLARYNGTGVDTIKTAVAELEKYGYLIRSEKQKHNEDGTFADYIWTTADPFENPVTVKTAHGKQDTKNTITKEKQIIKNKQENRASKISDDWQPTDAVKADFQTKYAGLDHNKEIMKFINYYQSNGKSMKDWNAAFRNWLIRAMEYQGITSLDTPKPLPKLIIGKIPSEPDTKPKPKLIIGKIEK